MQHFLDEVLGAARHELAADFLLTVGERLALGRVRSRLGERRSTSLDERLEAVLSELRSREQYADRLVVKSDGRLTVLQVDEVDWIEAADNYVSLHVGKATHLLRETMTTLEARLDPTRFLRISRSLIVNKQRVKELHPMFHGDFALILQDGTKLNSSRNYRHKLKESFGV